MPKPISNSKEIDMINRIEMEENFKLKAILAKLSPEELHTLRNNMPLSEERWKRVYHDFLATSH